MTIFLQEYCSGELCIWGSCAKRGTVVFRLGKLEGKLIMRIKQNKIEFIKTSDMYFQSGAWNKYTHENFPHLTTLVIVIYDIN